MNRWMHFSTSIHFDPSSFSTSIHYRPSPGVGRRASSSRGREVDSRAIRTGNPHRQSAQAIRIGNSHRQFAQARLAQMTNWQAKSFLVEFASAHLIISNLYIISLCYLYMYLQNIKSRESTFFIGCRISLLFSYTVFVTLAYQINFKYTAHPVELWRAQRGTRSALEGLDPPSRNSIRPRGTWSALEMLRDADANENANEDFSRIVSAKMNL